jgi:hypothetical protein
MGNMIHAIPTLTRCGINESVLSVRIDGVFEKSVEHLKGKCLDILKYLQVEGQKHKHMLVSGRKEEKFVQEKVIGGVT